MYSGALAGEAGEAFDRVRRTIPDAGLLAVTSADRLHAGWRAAGDGDPASHIEGLLAPLAPSAVLVTVLDGHPLTLSWLGSVKGHRVVPLGVDRFGQCGTVPGLYREYGIDAEAIVAACSRN